MRNFFEDNTSLVPMEIRILILQQKIRCELDLHFEFKIWKVGNFESIVCFEGVFKFPAEASNQSNV